MKRNTAPSNLSPGATGGRPLLAHDKRFGNAITTTTVSGTPARALSQSPPNSGGIRRHSKQKNRSSVRFFHLIPFQTHTDAWISFHSSSVMRHWRACGPQDGPRTPNSVSSLIRSLARA